MNLLSKITVILIALLLIAFGILFAIKTSNAERKTGVINALVIKKAHRTKNTFNISLKSAERVEFEFEEISPFFDIQRSIDIRPGSKINYLLSENDEVLSLRNTNNDKEVGSVFYIFNLLVSNVFIYVIILVLTVIQLAYMFYNFSSISVKKHSKVSSSIDNINQLFKKYVILIPLFFFLFFFLLYKLASNFNTLTDTTYGFSIQKYVLNFIVFWFLIIFLSVNIYLEKNKTL
ncbi:MAG: hypothetical protein EOP45_01205 [Sphingobacteriaceae bacterium]|nr:MAG: hypothetical protein EOP45_01205 [Sphingobacteriaceae bacterium]